MTANDTTKTETAAAEPEESGQPAAPAAGDRPAAAEIGGPQGPEPTRYGDWERKGRCVDF
ncbi:MAG: succinate dehydrogenase assembly factor 4 [Rhodospirillales bacterium]